MTDGGSLIEFDFTALAAGVSDLTISNEIIQDSSCAILNDSITSGSVTVQGTTAVPEPSSLFLINLGLVALAALTLGKRIPKHHATLPSL